MFAAGHGEAGPTLALRLAIGSALALPARAASTDPNGVGLIEWVASYTMGLRRTASGDRVASQDVLPRRHGLKVVGIDAGRVPAEMVEVKARRNWAEETLVIHPMRVLHRTPNAHVSVSLYGHALPDPAARRRVKDVINGRETSRPLEMAIDVADRLTLDCPYFVAVLLAMGAGWPQPQWQRPSPILQFKWLHMRLLPSLKESHFNPRPIGSV